MTRPLVSALLCGRRALALLAGVALSSACGSAPPAVHYYGLAVPGDRRAEAPADAPTLAVSPLSVDAAYDTERMVYRLSPYRFGYYNYHQWGANPGLIVADYLRQAYARQGLFREVVVGASAEAGVVLGGRIAAVDEIDETAERWVGRVALELWMDDARSGARLWSAAYDRRRRMPERSPEGLAKAVSALLAGIVAESAPALARVAAAFEMRRPASHVAPERENEIRLAE